MLPLQSRIVAPDLDIDERVSSNERKRQRRLQQRLHDHTYGITSGKLSISLLCRYNSFLQASELITLSPTWLSFALYRPLDTIRSGILGINP